MAFGVLIGGMVAGLIAAIVALISGLGIFMAFLIYSGVGIAAFAVGLGLLALSSPALPVTTPQKRPA